MSARTPQSLTSGSSSVSCADQRGRWGRGGVRKRRQADRKSSEAPEKPLSAAAGAHVHSARLLTSSSTVLTASPTQVTAGHPRADPAVGEQGGGCSTLRYREVRRDSRPKERHCPVDASGRKALLCPVPCGPALVCLQILAPLQVGLVRPLSEPLSETLCPPACQASREARSPASLLSQALALSAQFWETEPSSEAS